LPPGCGITHPNQGDVLERHCHGFENHRRHDVRGRVARKGRGADAVIATIDPARDVDGLHPTNAGLLAASDRRYRCSLRPERARAAAVRRRVRVLHG